MQNQISPQDVAVHIVLAMSQDGAQEAINGLKRLADSLVASNCDATQTLQTLKMMEQAFNDVHG